MTSLITLPIRLPLEITYRAAKLGVQVVRTAAGILGRDSAQERAPWPAEDVFVAEPIAVEEVEHVEAPIDFDAPSEEELAPAHVDTEAVIAYEAGPGDD